MLCSRIRLNDRRLRVIPSVVPQTPPLLAEPSKAVEVSTTTTTTAAANHGPFVRPCALTTMINACSSSAAVADGGTICASSGSSGSANSTMGRATAATTAGSTPRSDRSAKRYVSQSYFRWSLMLYALWCYMNYWAVRRAAEIVVVTVMDSVPSVTHTHEYTNIRIAHGSTANVHETSIYRARCDTKILLVCFPRNCRWPSITLPLSIHNHTQTHTLTSHRTRRTDTANDKATRGGQTNRRQHNKIHENWNHLF